MLAIEFRVTFNVTDQENFELPLDMGSVWVCPNLFGL